MVGRKQLGKINNNRNNTTNKINTNNTGVEWPEGRGRQNDEEARIRFREKLQVCQNVLLL